MLQHGELFHCSRSLKGENCCFFVYQRAGWIQGEREELGVEKYRKQKKKKKVKVPILHSIKMSSPRLHIKRPFNADVHKSVTSQED